MGDVVTGVESGNATGDPMDPDRSESTGSTERSEDELLARYAEALADGVEQALPGWVAAAVARRLPPAEVERRQAEIAAAGRAAADDVGRRVRELLRLDIDEQWTNPLSLIRSAIRHPTRILADAGAPEAARDQQAARFLPEDVYDLAPASFADLAPELHDLGISWGAAKAHVHLRRRRQEQVA